MNGGGRLPKQATEGNVAAPTSSGASKRLPRACIVLVLLLCAQIIFLAVVRIGPSSLRWEGRGAAIQALASSRFSLIRNSIFHSGASVESEGFSDTESEALTPPLLPKERRSRKERPVSHQTAAGKKWLMRHSKVGEAASDLQSEISTDQSTDESSDYVVDKFSSNTAESFYAEAKSRDEAPSDASVKSESNQKEGPSVASDSEARSLSIKKAETISDDHDKDASKNTKLFPETAARAKQVQDGESTSSYGLGSENVKDEKDQDVQREEKAEKAADIVSNAELEVKKEEPVIREQASESTTLSAIVTGAEQGRGDSEEHQLANSVKYDAGTSSQDQAKQQQPVIAKEASKNANAKVEVTKEDGELLADDVKEPAPPEVGINSNDTKQEDNFLTTEKENKNDAPVINGAEDGQSIKERQVPSAEAGNKDSAAFVDQRASEQMSSSECSYGYIYVYDLPSAFNRDIVSNCTALNPWLNLCPTLSNGGLGETLGKASPLGQEGSWYSSNHFMAEIVFHNRILQHKCLTDKMDRASAFYVPFYAGLDVGRYLVSGSSVESRDGLSNQLADWLVQQPAWEKSGGGSDHFMMIGRMTWDFRRPKDDGWGSGFFNKPAMQNITKLLIERNPWDSKEMAVPYPTNFHPQSDADLIAWQNNIRGLQRSTLFSFAGAPRKMLPGDFRGILFEQCHQTTLCRSWDCANGTCDDNQKTLEFFMDSTFCLQPRGDSYTRRSIFDCLLAGSIPVFFWRRSAYLQYNWHLPADEWSYSLFINRQDVRNGTKIEDVLKAISPEKVQALQQAVIQVIPKVVYAISDFAVKEKDAFDVAIEGVMRSFNRPRVSVE